MNSNTVNRLLVFGAFALGLIAVVWVGWGFVGTSAIALAMTLAIGTTYLLGAQEIRRYSALTAALALARTAFRRSGVLGPGPQPGSVRCRRCRSPRACP